ncbi:MAG: hypothetical protein ABI840_12690 [bacterium]
MKTKINSILLCSIFLFSFRLLSSQTIIQTEVAGFIDAASKQIVSTSSGRRYLIFAGSNIAGNTGQIKIYKGNSDGIPSSFSRVGITGTPIQQAWCVTASYSSDNLIHIAWFDNSNVYYTTFSTTSDIWLGSVATIGDGQPIQLSGGYPQIGIVGITMDVDSSGDPHVVYNWFSGNKERLRFRTKSGGIWSTAIFADDGGDRNNVHPMISFGPNNNLHLIWIKAASITESFGNSGSLLYRKRSGEIWGSTQTIVDSSLASPFNRPAMSIDQSPGILVTKDSVIHICYLTQRYFAAGNKGNYIRYFRSTNSGSNFTNQVLNNPDTLFTHDPCLAADGVGNVFIFGHDGDPETNFGPNVQYIKRTRVSGQWGQRINFAIPSSGNYDCSVSSRWQYYSNIEYGNIDVAFFNFSPFQIVYGNLNALKLDLKLGIEGFWNGTSQVEDTIRIYLRQATAPYSIEDSGKIYLDSNGEGAYTFKTNTPNNFYLTVKHRNSIETWSKIPVDFPISFSKVYDFTTSDAKAFGNNLTLKSGRYCIFSGDVNQDEAIDITDAGLVDNDAYNFSTGYLNTDIDGNGFIDLSDGLIVDNNAANFVYVIYP